MNILLDEKIEQLEKLKPYECWYLVKQTTDFSTLCYLVSILKKYQKKENDVSLEEFIEDEAKQIPDVNISTYRALRVAAFFGLISLSGSKYQNAKITPTFEEINMRCSGKFENKNLYLDIIQRQIEKMYISSEIDEESDGLRKEYRLFPIMLLYKILLELGRTTGNYSVSIIEYKYLIATTSKFEDFLDTLILIKLLRRYPEYEEKFNEYREKFDNRMIRAINELPVLDILEKEKKIILKNSYIDEIAKKIYFFEKNPNKFYDENYINFLGSTNFLINIKDTDYRINRKSNLNIKTMQKIYYGAPGTGKSYSVSKVIKEKYPDISVRENPYVVRTTIHQEYSYFDFIGNLQPDIDEKGGITYSFKPGPFSIALKKAFLNPENEIILIIEEMSRGNIAAIFGDIFQLLDRVEGVSEYSIDNKLIADYLKKNTIKNIVEDKIYIPNNLSIIGTVNTSDQNVNVMDTAFKRRFSFEYISVEPKKNKDKEYLNDFIFMLGEKTFNWITLYTTLNKFIVERLELSDDKQIGQFFIKFDKSLSDEENKKQIGDKLLQYLWEDIKSTAICDISMFNDDIKTFGQLYNSFNDNKIVFSESLIELYNTNSKILKFNPERNE